MLSFGELFNQVWLFLDVLWMQKHAKLLSYQSWRQVERNWDMKSQAPGRCGKTVNNRAKNLARNNTTSMGKKRKEKKKSVTLTPAHISFSSKQQQQYAHISYSYVELRE